MGFAGWATRAHLAMEPSSQILKREKLDQLKQRNLFKEETHSSSGCFLAETLSVLPDARPLLEEAPVVQSVGVRRQGSAENQVDECVKVEMRRGQDDGDG